MYKGTSMKCFHYCYVYTIIETILKLNFAFSPKIKNLHDITEFQAG